MLPGTRVCVLSLISHKHLLNTFTFAGVHFIAHRNIFCCIYKTRSINVRAQEHGGNNQPRQNISETIIFTYNNKNAQKRWDWRGWGVVENTTSNEHETE